MKALLVALLTLGSVSSFAIDGTLDGMKFCRSVQTGGMFGQPVGTRSHCLSFEGGRASDNANTFFGNPPESFTYDVIDLELINVDSNKKTGYVLKKDSLVIKETGAVLKRVK